MVFGRPRPEGSSACSKVNRDFHQPISQAKDLDDSDGACRLPCRGLCVALQISVGMAALKVGDEDGAELMQSWSILWWFQHPLGAVSRHGPTRRDAVQESVCG